MDIFSKKTQQLVQKVRPKSVHMSKNVDSNVNGSNNHQNSSDELSHSNTIECDSFENDQNSLDNSSSNTTNNSLSSFSAYKRNFLSTNTKSPVAKNNKYNKDDADHKLNGTFFILLKNFC